MVWEAGRSITPTLTTPPAGPSPAVLVHPLPNVGSTSKGEKIFHHVMVEYSKNSLAFILDIEDGEETNVARLILSY